ncbi:MAG: TldD/PmbA family protein [Oligoflexia bacterium]|nr:TldD/PmbA family protein [Oligoflexia bacterium]
MRTLLKQALSGVDGFAELRWHAKTFCNVQVERGRLEASTMRHRDGVAVRVLHDGTWGFASTSDVSLAGLRRALDDARAAARATAGLRRDKVPALPLAALAVGNFDQPGVADVINRSVDERVALVVELEARARQASHQLSSTRAIYREIFEEKAIVTTDGADCQFRLVRPELYVIATAQRDGQMQTASESVGATGGWQCIFDRDPQGMADKAVRNAVDLLGARSAEGGWAQVVMAPSIVGLLVHEAIGHTVEADFVQSGSAAKGRLNDMVASKLVTLCDSGHSDHSDGAGGTIPVDDEGVLAGRTEIIKDGRLVSYLHNRESAVRMGAEPTGNARAWEYADEPLIRMRNTYIEPGDSSVDELIHGVEDGYLLDGPKNGQADATAEFMFGVTTAHRIRKGKLGELVKGVTLTGNAFAVLSTVDGISREFRWDLGSGHCGKGQPMKVDAGGPFLRCRVMLGGEQSA